MPIPGIPTLTRRSDAGLSLGLGRGLTRRGAIGLGLAGAAALAIPAPSFAMTDDDARVLIDKAIADVNGAIESGKTGPALYAVFEQIFTKYADVPTIARSALGTASRQATPAQMFQFTTAFRGYVARKYGSRFREFIGAKFEVQDAEPVKSFYEVTTTAFLRGRNPFNVVWQVSDKSGRPLFFNIIIEGVNMLAAERTEIGAMLDQQQGDIDGLIRSVQAAG